MLDRARFRIDRIHIKDFRGIDDLTLTLSGEGEHGGLAVLAGDNGCGKTSALEAVLLALGQGSLLPNDSASLDEQVRFGAADFDVEVHLSGAAVGRPDVRANREALRHPERPGNRAGVWVPDTPNGPFWEEIDRLKPSVEYFSARREPEGLGDTPSSGPRSEREARRIAELKRSLVSTYYRSLRAQAGSLDGTPFARLQTFVSTFLEEGWTLDVIPVSNNPGSGDEVVVRRGVVPQDVTSLAMARGLAQERTDIPPILPIDRLSSGQLALFALAGPLIFRDVLADVVVIDEPEQHMHPKWQRVILGALRELSPESQFIVATHSLDVLDSALSTERHLLLRDEDPRASEWKAQAIAGKTG
jgi:energy-coupling factor transporter ATP-binding protein EcfA2